VLSDRLAVSAGWDIGRNSFAFHNVQSAMFTAFLSLSKALEEAQASADAMASISGKRGRGRSFQPAYSLLASVVAIDPGLMLRAATLAGPPARTDQSSDMDVSDDDSVVEVIEPPEKRTKPASEDEPVVLAPSEKRASEDEPVSSVIGPRTPEQAMSAMASAVKGSRTDAMGDLLAKVRRPRLLAELLSGTKERVVENEAATRGTYF
jgi:hypothetical protein